MVEDLQNKIGILQKDIIIKQNKISELQDKVKNFELNHSFKIYNNNSSVDSNTPRWTSEKVSPR